MDRNISETETDRYIQKRISTRVKSDESGPIMVTPKSNNSAEGKTQVLNIGGGGIAINNTAEWTKELKEENRLEIILSLPNRKDDLSIGAMVVNRSEEVVMLEFDQSNPFILGLIQTLLNKVVERQNRIFEKPVSTDIKILVVDSMKSLREPLIMKLKELNFENVIEAEHGAEAFEVLCSHSDIQLVFTGWEMPEMNGLEFLKKVRTSPANFATIPIIFSSSYFDKDKKVELERFNYRGYVAKPVELVQLKKQLEQTLKVNL